MPMVSNIGQLLHILTNILSDFEEADMILTL